MPAAGAIKREREGMDRITAFKVLARQYVMREQFYRNARERSGDQSDRADIALSFVQALEAEFGRCFNMVAEPDLARVDRMARGES